MRTATLTDLDIIVEGNCALASETEELKLDRDVLERGVRAVLEGRQPGAYRVLERDGRVAAQLMLTYEWSDWRAAMVWWIQSVYVWPDYRRQGLYRELYQAVKEEAQATGVKGLRLYVERDNLAAQKTYEAMGMDGQHYRMLQDMFDAY